MYSKGTKYGQLRLVLFGRQEFEEGLEYVKQRAYIHTEDSSSEPPVIYTTGVGSMEFGKVICQKFNVRLFTCDCSHQFMMH